MSKAYKCDRCGNMFEQITAQVAVTWDDDSPEEIFELCPGCVENLRRFMGCKPLCKDIDTPVGKRRVYYDGRSVIGVMEC